MADAFGPSQDQAKMTQESIGLLISDNVKEEKVTP
jgi:hypothetical protein